MVCVNGYVLLPASVARRLWWMHRDHAVPGPPGRLRRGGDYHAREIPAQDGGKRAHLLRGVWKADLHVHWVDRRADYGDQGFMWRSVGYG